MNTSSYLPPGHAHMHLQALAADLEDQEGAPRNAINRAYLQECAEHKAGTQEGASESNSGAGFTWGAGSN